MSPPLTDGADDHTVTFEPGSIAEPLFGAARRPIRGTTKAVDRCGTGLGVQWHPEWMERDDPARSWIVAEDNRRI